MGQAKKGDTVTVHYTGKLEDGTIFDSSADRDPIEFEIGANQVIRGFESAVIGMNPGEKKTTTIPADDAYGPRRDEMIVQVDRSELPDDLDPDVGDQLQLRQPDGQNVRVRVSNVSESKLTLDANHPLAGKELTFDIELVDVSD